MTLKLNDGLLAEYLFQGSASDSSGNDRHGTVFGAELAEDRFGNPDSAYKFDGATSYIVVSPAPPVHPERFSVSLWVQYSPDARLGWWNNCIIAQDGHHERRSFQLSTYNDTFTWHRFMTATDIIDREPLQRGKWYHLVAVVDGESHRLYRNGKLTGSQQDRLSLHPEEPLFIGRKSTDEPYFFFKGIIDDIRMYERALTADDVAELYTENGWVVQEEAAEIAEAAFVPNEPIALKNRNEPLRLEVENASITGSTFTNAIGENVRMKNVAMLGLSVECSNLNGTRLQNISFTNAKISDANLSDLEIDGAQLGGAYIHNIGVPPVGHPAYEEGVTQRPLRFEHCQLGGSVITDCDLSGVTIGNCKLDGMTIDGIPVVTLLEAYRRSAQQSE
ncbi:LamG-like jellyroll fold domain-containing protein [Paenibacillus sp. MBLB4367]|uniref:LamG-like jellyroll fold domain-containing protein n=1 Tax=Paenibacillus sp. MBLB4367 TaxID=3384767 RepID=UPI003907E7A2